MINKLSVRSKTFIVITVLIFASLIYILINKNNKEEYVLDRAVMVTSYNLGETCMLALDADHLDPWAVMGGCQIMCEATIIKNMVNDYEDVLTINPVPYIRMCQIGIATAMEKWADSD